MLTLFSAEMTLALPSLVSHVYTRWLPVPGATDQALSCEELQKGKYNLIISVIKSNLL